MIWDYNFVLLSYVFMRMSGCILFNPVFGRRNIPAMFRIGLTLFLTIFTYQMVEYQPVTADGTIFYMVNLLKEFLIGFFIGYIMQLFLSVVILGGELMDLQMGISMSKIYDPQSNVSMPVTGSVLNVMFFLLFFSSNAHLTMFELFAYLGTIAPYGNLTLNPGMYEEMVKLFSLILIYSVKLALPILAVEIVTEMCVGLLMKAVPQINIFALNIQLKIFMGFVLIVMLVPSFANFLERIIQLMFDQIAGVCRMLG